MADTRYITQVIANGTKVSLAIPGKNVDSIMLKLRKNRLRCVREAKVFLFYSRKTGSLAEMRIN